MGFKFEQSEDYTIRRLYDLISTRVWLIPLMFARHVVIGLARESCSHEVFQTVIEICEEESLMLWL